jgi:regulator of sigma E protease
MLTFLIFILALSVLVIVHELGHFLAAKKGGVLVEEFGLGYPPRLWGKKIGETLYSINLLLAGGFVRILGEESIEGGRRRRKIDSSRSFQNKPISVRFWIAAGGVLMNLIFAVLVFAVVYSVVGIPRQSDKVFVVGIAENSPAQQAGLKIDDEIVGVEWGGKTESVDSSQALVKLVTERAGERLKLLVNRRGQRIVLEITPRQQPPSGQGPLGIAISNVQIVKPPWWRRPFAGIVAGFQEALFWGRTISSSVALMLKNLFWRGEVPKDIAGPVGIYQATSMIQKQSGFWATLHFFGVLSVNLAIVNFLPFPALDGSRFVFLLWEAVTKRKPSPKIESWVQRAGMIFLLFLLLLVTIGDIRRLVSR